MGKTKSKIKKKKRKERSARAANNTSSRKDLNKFEKNQSVTNRAEGKTIHSGHGKGEPQLSS